VQRKWVDAYIDMAERFADLSHAKRLKVGAIVVKEHRVISIGYNGTPAGWDNECEEIIETHEDGGIITKTKDEVIHAEANAISKLARDGESGKESSMFLTHAPCIHCAKMIYGAGISSVFYRNSYRDDNGINFLKKCNVTVEKIDG
jgi:dCMP deaminase